MNESNGFEEDEAIGAQAGTAAPDTAADAVYVKEDGDAVLVYELDVGEETETSVSYGADTEMGLVHFLADGVAEDMGLTGDFSFVAEPTEWVADGSFETDEIESVEDLILEISGMTDRTESGLDAELNSAFSSEAAGAVPSASTKGELVTGSDRVFSSGGASYTTDFGGSPEREVLRFDLTGTDDEYTVEARERRLLEETRGFEEDAVADVPDVPDDSVPDENLSDTPEPANELTSIHPAEDWGTRDRAVETLSDRYDIDGTTRTADVTVESYSFENVTVDDGFGGTENASLLDVEYAVEYADVTEDIVEGFVEADPDVSVEDVSEDALDEMAHALRDVEIDADYASVSEDGETEINWSVEVKDYSQVTLANVHLSSEMTPDDQPGAEMSDEFVDDVIEQAEQHVEAVEASDHVSRWEWSGSLEGEDADGDADTEEDAPTGNTASVTGELTHTTENWEKYIEELEDRGLPTPADSSFELSVSSADGGLAGEVDWEAAGESLYGGYPESTTVYETGFSFMSLYLGFQHTETRNIYDEMFEDADSAEANVLRHLGEAEFRRAKIDGSVGENGWNVEAGTAFDNGTALVSAVEDSEGLRVTDIVGEQDDGVLTTYFEVEGFVDETTEQAVRESEQVDDETTVNMPGEWNRDFPEMDTEAASDYLEVEDGMPLLPGFGVAVALVAMLVVAAAAVRRLG